MRSFKGVKKNKGMTYVELIVVLSIFSVMTSIVLFNYKGFEDKVNIKVLANDIALKIVEAQKASVSGKLPASPTPGWKPSYGVYFDSSPDIDTTDNVAFNKKFIYFANLGDASDDVYNSGEELDTIKITKNNFIKDLKCSGMSSGRVDIVFRRPDSRALSCPGDVEIIVSSPGDKATAKITVSPSGRIQIN